MGFWSWIAVGLVAGIVAKMIMPGRDPGGFFVTILIGVVGAFLGGFISSRLGFGTVDALFDLRSFIIAVLGSLLLLFVYRRIKS